MPVRALRGAVLRRGRSRVTSTGLNFRIPTGAPGVGALGIKSFKSEPVDAVILDYWMADMNGLQVAREIRKINPAIPIIILSAYGELLDESLGIADLWIRKGEEDPQYLLQRLEQLLNSPPPR